MKKIALIGSTGSIGKQTLNVCRRHPDKFKIVSLAAGYNVGEFLQQVNEFKPSVATFAYPAGVAPPPPEPYSLANIQYESVDVPLSPFVNSNTGPEALNKPVIMNINWVENVGQIKGKMIPKSSLIGPTPSSFAASKTSVGIRDIALVKSNTIVVKPV